MNAIHKNHFHVLQLQNADDKYIWTFNVLLLSAKDRIFIRFIDDYICSTIAWNKCIYSGIENLMDNGYLEYGSYISVGFWCCRLFVHRIAFIRHDFNGV